MYVRNSISEFDPDRADRYSEFGDSTYGPIPTDNDPHNVDGFYIDLTKQNVLKLELAERMAPTEEQRDVAEVFLAKVTRVLSHACN